MNLAADRPCIAFSGPRRIACGTLADVVIEALRVNADRNRGPVLIFDERSSELLEVDFRGSVKDVMGRLAPPAAADAHPTAPAGDPPRGTAVPREVSLLPRHWAWLDDQPGGASVALRKLVEQARRAHSGTDAARVARESAYRFMSAMGSNLEGFEEATRALFAREAARFDELLRTWPVDVREHTLALALASFSGE